MDQQRRSREEKQRLIEEFESSGLRRQEFCQQHGIRVGTLDYWRRTCGGHRQELVEIKLAAGETEPGFTLSLSNGRRIESRWEFSEAGLSSLIRVAEQA
jgi:transposase-like protein